MGSRRQGLSLIEVLVVIGILAIAVALLLPAIQAARESARRASCVTNLRMMGIAIHGYSENHGCFPPLVVSGWGINTMLLPFLDMKDVFDGLNFSLATNDAANTTVVNKSLAMYLCPSDTKPVQTGPGFSSYHSCIGSGLYPDGVYAVVTTGVESAGIGVFGSPLVSPSDVTDGLTHTAAICEIVHGGSRDTRRPPLGRLYFLTVTPETQADLIKQCASLDPMDPSINSQPAGQPWVWGRGYTHLVTPGQRACVGLGIFGNTFSPITVSSRHRGGVNLLLADGHVRFVENDIDVDVWRAVGTRNGSEQVEF